MPAALLKVQTLPDGTQIGRFRYGDRYLQRAEAVALDPYRLPLDKTVHEFTQLKGIPGALRDASPDAWGRRVIEHKLERAAGDLHEIDYLLHGPQDGAGYLSFGLKAEPPAPKRQYNRTYQLAELVAAALADNLRRWSDKPEADCAELFRRMVFNAAVTNNDDHPRNHALLRRPKGWRLSPAYDLVPAPVVRSLKRCNIQPSIGLVVETSLHNIHRIKYKYSINGITFDTFSFKLKRQLSQAALEIA